MSNSDRWIDLIATKAMKLSTEEAADITRIVLDGRRGEPSRLRVYWDNLGAEEIFDLLPVAGGRYKMVEVETERED